MKDKKTILAVALLLLLVAAAGVLWIMFRPQTVSGEKNIVVEVTHKNGSVNTYEIRTAQEYLYDAMEEYGIIGELTDGYFTVVDGEEANSADEEWWGYTKAGEYVNYGAGECVINDGEHYEFTFNTGW